MPYSTSDALNIFLSYASEDSEIADALARTLRAAFVKDVEVTMMSEFPNGVNFRRLIVESIAQTDVLVAIATGRLKPSHSFTGVEIGMFLFSQREKPDMARFKHLARRMIPFAVLARVPDTINEFEGIDIDPSTLRDVRFDPTNLAANLEQLYDPGQNNAPDKMMYKLLIDIEDMVNQANKRESSVAESEQRIDILRGHARALCQEVFSLMLNREKEVTIPKSKLIIRLDGRAGSDQARSIDGADLRIEGPCFEAFGFPNEQKSLTWEQFIANADDEDIVFGWRESLNSLISSAQHSKFIDNNVILSFDRKKIFRIFASRIATYYSNSVEYDVYVIEMLRARDYGDPETTLLLKAMQVALGYRFMFLEEKSEFSPAVVKTEEIEGLQKRVLNLINSLNLLLQTADEYKLSDPKVVLNIMGMEITDRIEEMHDAWKREKNALYGAAKSVLKAEGVTKTEKDNFIRVLTSFCNSTRAMNRDYIASVLVHLRDRIETEDTSATTRRSRRPRLRQVAKKTVNRPTEIHARRHQSKRRLSG